MKACVDKSICIGCGVCASIASSIFALVDEGVAENVLGENVPSDLEEAAVEASEACPVGAIIIE